MINLLLFPTHLLRLVLELLRWIFADDGPRLFSRPTETAASPEPGSVDDGPDPGYVEILSANGIRIEGSVDAWLRDYRAGEPAREAAAKQVLETSSNPAEVRQAKEILHVIAWGRQVDKNLAENPDYYLRDGGF